MNPPVGTLFHAEHCNKYVEAAGCSRARAGTREQLETRSSAGNNVVGLFRALSRFHRLVSRPHVPLDVE